MLTFNEILLVEDEPFQRSLLEKLLVSITGARIRLASHGGEALAHLDAGAMPQLVLSDLEMPEMDGIELLHRLAERGFEGYVILLSAVAEDVLSSVKQMAESYGIRQIEVLPKPISPVGLSALLDEYQRHPLPRRCYRPDEPRPAKPELQSALKQGQLQAYFQPQLDARTQRVVGAEALVRWAHPQRGLLGPGAFIGPLAELGGLAELTRQMLTESVAACARWHRQGHNWRVSVNVAPSDLVADYFAEQVLGILDQQGLAPELLTLEVTETEICPHLAKAQESTSRLRMHGVKVAIDDFGTGHSSLQQLVTSPFTELKVDRCFIRDMLTQDKQRLIVKLALRLAQELGLVTVAEGVESQLQADLLDQMGCDRLQGFLYAPAMPEAQFLCWALQQNERVGVDLVIEP